MNQDEMPREALVKRTAVPLRGWRFVRLRSGTTYWRTTVATMDSPPKRVPLILSARVPAHTVSKWVRRQAWIAHLIGPGGEVIDVQ